MAQITIEHTSMFFGASPQLHEFAKQLRNNPTYCEKLLWQQLNKKQLFGNKFRRQHPILYFVADFYCHQAKLIIEVDGGILLLPEQFEYDLNRDEELKELGITVLRFTNEQVETDINTITRQIQAFLSATIIPHRTTSPL